MKIGYLVFAYKNPGLLKQAIETLSNEDSAIFIHIDQKCSIQPFSGICGANVFFSEKRIPVYWGEFSGVEAIMLLMRQGLASPENYDYFVLLSGSDYPIQSAQYIHHYLEANRGGEFISCVKMPNEAAGKPISRINTVRPQSGQPIRRFTARALAKLGMAQRDYRKFLGKMEPYSGSTWWTLSRNACHYILDFAATNGQVVEFFRDTFAPEEMFFHTILGNSPFLASMRRTLLYEDWSNRGAHPAMINDQHLRLFEAQEHLSASDIWGSSEVLFARKFSDETLDAVRRIDEIIQRRDKSPESLSGHSGQIRSRVTGGA